MTKGRVLVTGANGFLGRHVLSELGDFEVHPVGRARCDLLVPGEPARLVAAVKPTHLLHLAWCTKPGEYWTSLENLAWARSSLELVEAFAKEGGKRAVIAGSCAEYDWSSGHCSEKTPLAPGTLYGKSKHGLHVVLEGLAEKTGISLAWGRIFFLFGPGEPKEKLVSDLLAKLRRGEVATCRTGDLERDFVYVKDAAKSFAALLRSQAQGSFNVASGRTVPVKDVALAVAREAGREDLLRFENAPSREPPVLSADVSRWKEVGWSPSYSLESAVADMAKGPPSAQRDVL